MNWTRSVVAVFTSAPLSLCAFIAYYFIGCSCVMGNLFHIVPLHICSSFINTQRDSSCCPPYIAIIVQGAGSAPGTPLQGMNPSWPTFSSQRGCSGFIHPTDLHALCFLVLCERKIGFWWRAFNSCKSCSLTNGVFHLCSVNFFYLHARYDCFFKLKFYLPGC